MTQMRKFESTHFACPRYAQIVTLFSVEFASSSPKHSQGGSHRSSTESHSGRDGLLPRSTARSEASQLSRSLLLRGVDNKFALARLRVQAFDQHVNHSMFAR